MKHGVGVLAVCMELSLCQLFSGSSVFYLLVSCVSALKSQVERPELCSVGSSLNYK